MFGVLVPALGHVSPENKQLYQSAYCNLCAALSASGVGVFNRLFLINDVVTSDWLLTEGNGKGAQHVFSCKNCVKGGVICQKKRVPHQQTLLAAISTYACGVKVNDNALDHPSLFNKALTLLFRRMMKKSEKILQSFNVLDKLQACLALNRHNEALPVRTLEEACKPTEQCYEVMALAIAESKGYTDLPESAIALFGQYLGRCTYLIDAIKDMEQDQKRKQYNILNILSDNQNDPSAKAKVVGQSLEFLKSMRHNIDSLLSLLPDEASFTTLREKCDSLFISTERQLAKLIQPLNNSHLTNLLSSFSNRTICSICSVHSCGSTSFLDRMMRSVLNKFNIEGEEGCGCCSLSSCPCPCCSSISNMCPLCNCGCCCCCQE